MSRASDHFPGALSASCRLGSTGLTTADCACRMLSRASVRVCSAPSTSGVFELTSFFMIPTAVRTEYSLLSTSGTERPR